MSRYAVIMAGGAGTRLWPLSRRNRPKQLLRLFDGKSLLRGAFERLAGFVGPDRIYVITGDDHLPQVAEQLPELPAANLIGEPCGRDTANAVCLSACVLAARDPAAVMGVFTADHIIRPIEKFHRAVEQGYAAAAAHPDALVTFGIRPSIPHTGLGYVQRGESLGGDAYAVREFKEKPDRPTAEQYLAGDYYWNSGMFVWRVDTILGELRRHLPDSANKLRGIADAWDAPDRPARLAETYPTLQKNSIDYAVMEKARRVLVVEMNCDWLDVGSWPALAAALTPDESGNVSTAERTAVLDGRSNILVSEGNHLIAAIGVDDLVVVHSEDATLVCRREDAQRIKDLVAELERRFGRQYS
jgi:mannose-1-phosphate guanylyltransferase